MSDKYIIIISQRTSTKPIIKRLVLEAVVTHNDFNENDTAALLFEVEFGANTNSVLPIRMHINEVGIHQVG